MWYPAVITDAADRVLTRDEVRAQVGDTTIADAVCDRLVDGATGWVEKYCGIKVGDQDLELKCDAFCDFRRLPVAPVQSVTISYVDDAGATQALATSVYELRTEGLIASIVLKYNQAWPAIQPGSRITVAAVAGYAAEDLPAELLQAILLRISKLNSVSRADPMLRGRTVDGVGSRQWDTSGQALEVVDRAVSDLLENFRCFPS